VGGLWVRWQKNNSFANFGRGVGWCDLQMCCFVRWQ